MHTAPPRPPFIHWAQLLLQPPDDAPPQLRVAGAASTHVPDAGVPNSWTTGAGAELDDELEEDDPPLLVPVVMVPTMKLVQNSICPGWVMVKV